MLLTSIRLAIRGLNRNKLRTVLTMLGMIIGVAAVMTMVALGNGAQQSVEQDVRSAGTSLIHVNAGNYTRGGEESKIATGLGVCDDADAGGRRRDRPRRQRHQGLRARRASCAGGLPRARDAYYGQVLGTDVPFASMFGWRFDEGRFFSAADVAARRPVAVLGRTTRDQIFGAGANAVGQAVTIHGRSFTYRRRHGHRRSRSDGDGVRAVHGAPGRARHPVSAHDHDRSRAGGRGLADCRRNALRCCGRGMRRTSTRRSRSCAGRA